MLPVISAIRGILAVFPAALAMLSSARAPAMEPHFDIVALGDSVFSVIRREPPGFAVNGNTLLIVCDSDVVVVDTDFTRQAAGEVIAAIRAITTKPVRFVVNTHWHDDHVMGNQAYQDAFPGVRFIAQENTKEGMLHDAVTNREQQLEGAPAGLKFFRDALASGKSIAGGEMSDDERASWTSTVAIMEQYVAESPTARPVIPEITFGRRYVLRRGSRTIELLHFGPANTNGDAVVFLPKERIVATGDLVVAPIPFTFNSHIAAWIRALDSLRALGARIYVPGHGPVMRDDVYIGIVQRLLESVRDQTAAAVADGDSLARARTRVDLTAFRRSLAGESPLLGILFDQFVSGPAVAQGHAEASLVARGASTQVRDSASAARAAYGAATAALRAGDPSTAKERLRRAASAWPTQEAYAFALARVAAEQGDSVTAFAALGQSASLGVGRDIAHDSSFAKFAGSPTFARLKARLDRNRAPIAASHVIARLADENLFLESLVYDASARRFFATDVKRRRVVAIDSLGRATTFVSVPSSSGAPLGIALDPGSHTLWVGTAVPAFPAERDADSTRHASLIRIDIARREIVRTFTLPPAAGGHVIGDVACSGRGDVYATDSSQPVIFRVAAGSDRLERWLTHPLFHSLQGLALSDDERVLFVADYSLGLLRIGVGDRSVRRIADAPHSTTLGIDGLRSYRGSLVAIQNGIPLPRVVRISLDEAGSRVRRFDVIDQNLAVADEPTNGTLVGDALVYPSHVPWNEHDDSGEPKPGATLRAPVLLSLPLRPR